MKYTPLTIALGMGLYLLLAPMARKYGLTV
jgi:hypothetical protein